MKRLLLITAFLLAVPCASIGNNNYTVYAGHTVPQGWSCTCGCDGCTCDAGEIPERCTDSATRPGKEQSAKNEELMPLGVIGLTMLLLLLKRFTA